MTGFGEVVAHHFGYKNNYFPPGDVLNKYVQFFDRTLQVA